MSFETMNRDKQSKVLRELRVKLSGKKAAEICDLVEEGDLEYLYDTRRKDGGKKVWAQRSTVEEIPVVLFYYLEPEDDSLQMSVIEWTSRAHHVAAGSGGVYEVVWSMA